MTWQDDFENALSLERFSRYSQWVGGDREAAISLYTLNTQLSESLYLPLQMLEVALRNRIHTVLTSEYNDKWFYEPELLPGKWQPEQVRKAIADLEAENRPITPGRIVAALTFNFWTSMFSADHENLWQMTLHKIARRPDGRGLRRKDFSGPLTKIRILRNRIAHHEPILHWNLPEHHHTMLQLTGWLSPAAAAWCVSYSRFENIYPSTPIKLNDD